MMRSFSPIRRAMRARLDGVVISASQSDVTLTRPPTAACRTICSLGVSEAISPSL